MLSVEDAMADTRIELSAASFGMTGQPVTFKTAVSAEHWQFFAFVFAALRPIRS